MLAIGGTRRKGSTPVRDINKKRGKSDASQAQASREIIPAAATAGDERPPAPQIDRESTEVDRQQVVEKTTRSGRKAKSEAQLIEAMLTEISESTSSDVEREIFSYVAVIYSMLYTTTCVGKTTE